MTINRVLVAIAASILAATGTAAAPAHPWESAQAVLTAAEADIRTGGVRAVQSHTADLEAALASAGESWKPSAVVDGKTTYVLTDGMSETLLALTAAAVGADKDPAAKDRKTVAINNPYPLISFYLGSYYNEIGNPAEALRVLDVGLGLPTALGAGMGQHRPIMISERGAALIGLKRWDDALADYDDGLKLEALKDLDRARFLRGRGFALTEIGRLDDAETAYRDSLKVEPGNAGATRELQYIAGLRAGRPATASVLVTPNAQKPKGGAQSPGPQ
jgi:tetratricopeptide (TPR) repeat protein